MRSYIWIITLTGCFETIEPNNPDAQLDAGKVTTTRSADGTYMTVIDSTSATEWTHADFESGMQAAPTAAWDLRFQRFHISTNGGVSGDGGVQIASIKDVPFAQVTSPPTTGWISDAPDGEDVNTDPEYAFEQGEGWYDYNPMTHVVMPKPLVWIVKTNGGATVKLEITKYYDDAGTAGWLTLHWSPM